CMFRNQRREQVVHRARLRVEGDLPQQGRSADVCGREDLLVLHPAGARVVEAFRQKVGREHRRATARQQHCQQESHGHLHGSFLSQISFVNSLPVASTSIPILPLLWSIFVSSSISIEITRPLSRCVISLPIAMMCSSF